MLSTKPEEHTPLSRCHLCSVYQAICEDELIRVLDRGDNLGPHFTVCWGEKSGMVGAKVWALRLLPGSVSYSIMINRTNPQFPQKSILNVKSPDYRESRTWTLNLNCSSFSWVYTSGLTNNMFKVSLRSQAVRLGCRVMATQKQKMVQLTLALIFLNPLIISIIVLDEDLSTLVSTTWVVTDPFNVAENRNLCFPKFFFLYSFVKPFQCKL